MTTIIVLFCIAWALTILLSACKAAGRNPLAGGGVESIDTLVPSMAASSTDEISNRGKDMPHRPWNLDTAREKSRQDRVVISRPSDLPASHPFTSAVQPEAKTYSAGLGGSAGARDSFSSESKSPMAPALTGNFLGCHSWPTLKGGQPHRLSILQASCPSLAHLLIVGQTLE